MNWPASILFGGLVLLWSCVGFGQTAGEATSHSPPIPHPSLENVGPDVRAYLQEERRRFEAVVDSNPPAPTGRLAQAYSRLARVYHAYRFHEAALACYLNLETIQPGIYPCLYAIGWIHHSEGRFGPALNYLTKAKKIAEGLEDTPPEVIVAMNCLIGDAALKQGQLPEAVKAFEQAVDLNPECAYAWHGLGVVHSIENRSNEAIECLERAIGLQPHASAGRALLVREYRRAGREEKAAEMLAESDFRRTTRFAFHDPIIAQDVAPLNRSARSMHSRALRARKQGDLHHAVDLFKKAIERDPQFTLAKANLAGVYLTLNRLDQAEMISRQLLEERSDDASFHHLLGTALFRQGKFDLALRSFRRAGELEPDRGKYGYWIGAALSWQGNYREALTRFNRASDLNEANVDARIGAAIMLARLGKHSEAKKRLRRCVERFPESVPAKLNWARFLSADPDSRRKEADQALGLALPVYERVNSVPAAVTVAMAAAAADDFSKAVEVQRWAIQHAAKQGYAVDLPWMKRQLHLYQDGKPCRDPWNEARGFPAVKGLIRLQKESQ